MKYFTTFVVLALAMTVAAECQAQRPKREGQRKAQPGERKAGGDPAEMAARMMKKFDANGDNQLDRTEVTAMLKSMRERRAGGGQAQGKGRGRAAEGRPGGKQAGQAKRGKGAGVKPNRPAAN